MSTPKVRNVSPTSALSYSPVNCLAVTKRHPAPNHLGPGMRRWDRDGYELRKELAAVMAVPTEGSAFFFCYEIWAPAVVNILLSYLFLWTSGSQADLMLSLPPLLPPNLGETWQCPDIFGCHYWGSATGRLRMLLNIHNKELPTPNVSNAKIEKLCSRL